MHSKTHVTTRINNRKFEVDCSAPEKVGVAMFVPTVTVGREAVGPATSVTEWVAGPLFSTVSAPT